MNLSLRARLVAGIAVLLTCGLLVADVSGVLLLRSYLLRRLDQQLSAPFDPPPQDDVADVCSAPPGGRPSARQLPTSFVLTVLDRSGAVRCRLPDTLTAADDVPDLADLGADGLSSLAASGAITTVQGSRASAGWRVRVAAADEGYTVVAVSLTDVRATVRRLQVLTATTSLVILGLAVIGGFLVVRVALRPLNAIEVTAFAIAAGDLSRRVEPAPAGTEVGRLSASLNAMLGQIEEAFDDRTESEERLRRFVADASHELRTPLATIRGHAELYRQGVATTPEDVERLLGRIESESVRMGALVEDLLLLARLDAAPQLVRRPVDLLSLAADAVVDARAQDPDRAVTLVSHNQETGWSDEPPVVDGDEARLRQVIANLLGNALRHTPAGSPVEADVGVRDGTAVLRVVDHGPGLRPAVAERVFERFYRDDAGRDRDHGGTGLGLAIVRSIVDAHDGRVWYEPTPGGGSRFAVALPLGVHTARETGSSKG